MKRCQRCILPDNYPGIEFDADGVCSFCANYKKLQPSTQKQQELMRLVEKAGRNKGRYQAIVPISGGKDSAYALYMARREFGLRVLAINFDNGFRSPSAEANLKTLTTKLGVDYISIKPNWELMRNLYGAFVKITGEFCTVCNAMGYLTILTRILEEQKRVGSKLLVFGGWSENLEAMPGVYSFDFKYFYDVIDEAGLSHMLRDSPMIDELCLDVLINSPDPRITVKDKGVPFDYIMLPDYVTWDVNRISSILKERAGWSPPASSEDQTHFDCDMYPVAKYFERRKYGFSQNTITYSAMIRAGLMSRRQALEKIMNEPKGVPAEFPDFLNVLGISATDINYDGKWHPQRMQEEKTSEQSKSFPKRRYIIKTLLRRKLNDIGLSIQRILEMVKS